MIDLYYIIIPPEVLGPQQLQRIRERHPSDTQGFRKIPLEAPNWMGRQWAMLDGATVRLKVCPAKVLGRWNTWGSSDLRRVVLDTAPLVLRELGVRVTAEVLAHLAAGNYRLHEVHIAHQFWLRNRGITDFVQSVARTIGESHRPQLFPPGRGHGFYLDPWSRTRSWVCYNKQHETEQKAVPR
jgi:II/X family phage/plasmid replication protein